MASTGPTVALHVDDAAFGPTPTSPALPAATNNWQMRVGALFTQVTRESWTVRSDDVAFFVQ